MTESPSRWRSWKQDRRRRQAVQQALAEATADGAADGAATGAALARAMNRLGSVFAEFGMYLSSRPDLLPLSDCLTLADVPDCAEPATLDDIRMQFREAVGRTLEDVFKSFTEAPFESRRLYQSHRARLYNDRDVIVRFLRPSSVEAIRRDVPLLRKLHPALRRAGWSKKLFTETIGEFERTFERQIDLRLTAQDLEDLARSESEGKRRGAPRVFTALSGPCVLTVERLPGRRLDDVIAGDNSIWSEGRVHPAQAARELCTGWLERAFHEGVFPGRPSADRVVATAGGGVAFTAAPAVRLSSKERANLWEYLVASAEHRPDRACRALLSEMQADEATGEVKALEHRIRQIVPFRDGGWSDTQADDTLAEHLFLHWRAAVEQGYRPNPGLASFIQGFFLCARTAHLLDPDGDPLVDAFVELQNQMEAQELRDMADPGHWSDTVDRYAATVAELPQRLDGFLSRAAKGDLHLNIRIRETEEHRRRRNASSIIVSLLFLLASVALVAYHLSEAASVGIRADQVGAVVFIVLGAFLLWAVTRA